MHEADGTQAVILLRKKEQKCYRHVTQYFGISSENEYVTQYYYLLALRYSRAHCATKCLNLPYSS